VTQPQIAEVVVDAPDEILINGKAVGATSLVVWLEEKTEARK
jgi:Flp pilus assembly secretin CpaC